MCNLEEALRARGYVCLDDAGASLNLRHSSAIDFAEEGQRQTWKSQLGKGSPKWAR